MRVNAIVGWSLGRACLQTKRQPTVIFDSGFVVVLTLLDRHYDQLDAPKSLSFLKV